jgi:hypothetical protein
MSARNLNAVAVPVAALAGGSWIMLIFMVVLLAGVVFGYFTTRGSGISEHPYGKVYGGAPGAIGPGSASGRDPRARIGDWSRGTR